MKTILVVGGAGYIGSHMVKLLTSKDYKVVVLDKADKQWDLGAEWIQGDFKDRSMLTTLFNSFQFDAVMHFGAYIEVGESVQDPEKYYYNNVVNTLNLLHVMMHHDVKNLIFSSTAAAFGNPQYTPIDEKHPIQPINPYGRSKVMVEAILEDYDKAYGLKSIALRYFNAAGADPEGELGECHDPESHLIPIILQVASGIREKIFVYGNDYDTADGTCVRDYIHVSDLCQAHLLALEKLLNDQQSARYNLGNGNGFSVQQVIDTARKVTGKNIPQENADKRAGDPAVLIADSKLAKQELKWQPQHTELESIIADAWQWEQKLRQA